MANYCAECTYLDLSNERDGKFWCDKRLERHAANELSCDRYCKAYSRGSSVSKSAYDYSEEHTNNNNGCYLTTMICRLLGFTDNNVYLETLRQFRKNVLQKNDLYKKLLVEYDIVGPEISKALNNDPENKKIAKSFFENYLLPIVGLLHQGKRDKALCLYIDMTNKLKNLYNLNNLNISTIQVEQADIQNSGHGRYVKKKTIY